MQTINLYNSTFTVRPETLETIRELKPLNHTTVAAMLVEFFDRVEDVYSDEYALAVAIYYPKSNAWGSKRQARCATDVRKYNKAEFTVQQETKPEKEVKHLDGGTRRASRDMAAAEDALSQIDDQLS